MASIKTREDTSDECILKMDVEEIQGVSTILTQGNLGDAGPMIKKQKLNDEDAGTTADDGIKAILFNMNHAICRRLDNMERQLTSLQSTCIKMGQKVDSLNLTVSRALAKMKDNETAMETNGALALNNAVVVGIPQEEEEKDISTSKTSRLPRSLNRNVTLITLNTEDDFPTGSWLGDEANLECRVRCGISSTDMLHVMQTAKTPEKCALKLLDFLFDRETQATSNLSGTGKHGKRQLDPLMIYGLRCHLIKHFNIAEGEWYRIRMNIDSKCRTAFRRKQRGLPLTVKAFGYKTGTPENDRTLSYTYVDSQDTMNDSHSSDEGVNIRPTQVHVELAMDDAHLGELPNEEQEQEQEQEQERHQGEGILKKVQIPQDSIQLQEGQINITQSGEIQIAVVEENGTAEATLLLQQNTSVRDGYHHHHHHHPNDDEEEVITEVRCQVGVSGATGETH